MKRGTILWLILCLSILAAGCSNKRELDELSVTVGVGIDKEDGRYRITAQSIDPSQMSKNRSTSKYAVKNYQESGSSLFEAIRRITTKSPRKLFFSHMRVIFISEQVAREGILEPLDFFFRDHESRPDFDVVITKKYTANQILNMVTPFETVPAIEFYKSLEVSQKAWAPTVVVPVLEVMRSLNGDAPNLTLSGITIRGNEKEAEMAGNVKQPRTHAEYQYTNLGVFEGDRLVGWLGEKSSKSVNFVKNKVKSTVGTYSCPNDSTRFFVVEVIRSKATILPRFANGNPEATIRLKVKANIGENQCALDMTKEASLRTLEKLGQEQLKDIIESGIAEIKQRFDGVDVFGIDQAFYRKYPVRWTAWKSAHPRYLKEMPVHVQVDYHVRKMGKIISRGQKIQPTKERT